MVSTAVKERVEKLVDPEVHFAHLAKTFRDKLEEVNKAYKDCLDYGLWADFYLGPNSTYTYLPDKVRFKRTQTWDY